MRSRTTARRSPSASTSATRSRGAALTDVVEFKLSVPSSRAPASGETVVPTLMENPPQATFLRTLRRRPAAGRIPVELRDLDMRIAHDGTWHYRGSPINRPPLWSNCSPPCCAARATAAIGWSRRRSAAGLSSRTRRSSPSLSTSKARAASQRLIFRTNLDEIVAAGPRASAAGRDRRRRHAGAVYFGAAGAGGAAGPAGVLRAGRSRGRGGRSTARPKFGVWSDGMFFELGDPGEEDIMP